MTDSLQELRCELPHYREGKGMSQPAVYSAPQLATERPLMERREAVRHQYRQALSCFILPKYERFWAWARNISVSGIGMIANRQLKPETLLVLQLRTRHCR
jgi:hypothetical protein